MNSFSERLREERKRLGLSQTEMASVAGVQKGAQINYEAGKRSPDAEYLGALGATGLDVQFVITGERQGHGIGESAVHQAVLDAVDLLSLDKAVNAQQLARAVVKLAIKGKSSPTDGGGATQTFNGPVGGVAGRDIVNNR